MAQKLKKLNSFGRTDVEIQKKKNLRTNDNQRMCVLVYMCAKTLYAVSNISKKSQDVKTSWHINTNMG